MMTKLSIALAFAVFAAVSGAAAQTYPTRPVTVIVPFAAGGVTDIVARIVSERMKTALGQSVIIENVSGAGGTIGVTRLFRAAPDGYTLVVGQWTSHVGAGAMYPVTFDYSNDFEPVSMLSVAPLWIVGRNNLPAKDLPELLSRPKLQNVIKADLPQPVGTQNALPAEIERRRAQQTVKRSICH